MLLQSTKNTISLLKALPDAWRSGYVTGLKAKGGLTVDIYWDDGKLKETKITAANEYNGRLLCKDTEFTINLNKGQSVSFELCTTKSEHLTNPK